MANEFKIWNPIELMGTTIIEGFTDSSIMFTDEYETSAGYTVPTVSAIKTYVTDNSGILWSTPVDSSIIPNATNTYNLGEYTRQFKKAWISNGIYSGLSDKPILKYDSAQGTILYGYHSGELLDTFASWNTLIGDNTGTKLIDGTNNVIIGAYAGYDSSAHDKNNVYIGTGSGARNYGSGNVFIGQLSGQSPPLTTTSRSHELIIASDASTLIWGDFVSGRVNIAKSLYIDGSLVTIGSGGSGISWSTAVDSSIIPNATNTYNLGDTSKGFKDIYSSGKVYYNDYRILDAGVDEKQNISLGSLIKEASANNHHYNITIGRTAPTAPYYTGSQNIFIGMDIMNNFEVGGQNIVMGNFAGYDFIEGNSNLFLGLDAGRTFLYGDRNVFIGPNVRMHDVSTNDKLVIGNSSDPSANLITGDFVTGRVDIAKFLYIDGSLVTPTGGSPVNFTDIGDSITQLVTPSVISFAKYGTNGIVTLQDASDLFYSTGGTITGPVIINSDNSGIQLEIKSNNDSPTIRLFKNDATVIADELIGSYQTYTNDDSSGGTGIASYINTINEGNPPLSKMEIGLRGDLSGVATTKVTISSAGDISTNGDISANSFIKSGGITTEFLKADGTIDSSDYATVSYVDDRTKIQNTDTFNYGYGSSAFTWDVSAHPHARCGVITPGPASRDVTIINFQNNRWYQLIVLANIDTRLIKFLTPAGVNVFQMDVNVQLTANPNEIQLTAAHTYVFEFYFDQATNLECYAKATDLVFFNGPFIP